MNLVKSPNELDQIENEIELHFSDLRCNFKEDNIHFLNEPKLLPCGKTACLECIKGSFDTQTHVVKCNLCKSDHAIEDLNQLKTSPCLIDNFNLNTFDQKGDDLIKRLNTYIESLNESYKNKDELIEKLCEKAKHDVYKRIEAVKSHLDDLHKQMLNSLEKIKQNVYKEMETLNEQIENKTSEYEEFSRNMEKMLENFEQNKEQLEKNMYECQDFIEELNNFDDKFHSILRKVSFEPSEWLPDDSFVETYIGKFKLSELIDENDKVLADDILGE